MLSNDLKQILLLNPVRVNHRLGKHKKPPVVARGTDGGDYNNESGQKSVGAEMDGGFDLEGFTPTNPRQSWIQTIRTDNIWDGIPFSVKRVFNSPFSRMVVEWYIKFRLFVWNSLKDPTEMFPKVKEEFKMLEFKPKQKEEVVEIIKKLEASMQTTALNSARSEAIIVVSENILAKTEFNRYQTESSLIKFILQCKKGLCLTEIDEFDKIIPDDVTEKINRADDLKVFDNFYILYYDPKGTTNIHYTEKPKPKDPICFGVIRGSDKMYFIADWIDEYCNLTYKDVLKTCGVEDNKLETK